MKSLSSCFSYASFALIILFAQCKNETEPEKKITDIPVSSKSADAVAAYTKGLALIDLGDFQAAKPFITKAVELDPKFSVAYLFKVYTDLASLKAQTDDINQAKATLDTATASEWEKLYVGLFDTYLTADWNKRLEITQKIANDYPFAARAQADLGQVYQNGNQFDKARSAFEKSIQLDSSWVGGYVNLGSSYLFNDPKDFAKAEEYAQKVVEMAPNSVAAEINLGDCYRAQNKIEKARDAYARAIALDSTSYGAYYKEGYANGFLGNYEEAIKNYMAGSRYDELKFQYVVNVATSYLYAGDHKKAQQFLKSQLPVMDSSGEARDILVNDKNGALSAIFLIATFDNDLAKMKEIAPMMEPLIMANANYLGTPESILWAKESILYNQAAIDLVAGKLDSAKAKAEAIKTMLEPIKDPTKLSDYHFILGQVAMRQKNYPEAIVQFEQVNPGIIYNKYLLAQANEMAGNKAKAAGLYKEIAVYNFNDVGYALIRNDAIRKSAGM